MPVIPLKLTDEFVQEAVDDGCPIDIILDVQKTLSADPTAGLRVIELYDDPSILPGSGWYQHLHTYDRPERRFAFETLHLYIAYDVQGHLIGYLPSHTGLTRLITRAQRDKLREIGLMIAGRAYYPRES